MVTDVMGYYFICEDSLEGVFSGIYEAYLRKSSPEDTHFCAGEVAEYSLFAEYVTLDTNKTYAEKVQRTIIRKMGQEAFIQIGEALASTSEEKADAAYQTIVLGVSKGFGMQTMQHLSNHYVRKIFELSRRVRNESGRMLEFLRFEELESGILFARIGPENNVITHIAPHFTNRFPRENFIIYDENRNLMLLHRAGVTKPEWVLAEGDVFNMKEGDFLTLSSREPMYQECFQYFCEKIAIESRINPKLQRNMLPLHFRGYMTEFKKHQ